jgi:beta-lactamase regulating signal transducer with metallopeptidase domain
MYNQVFLTILNMSLVGAFVVIAVCLARIPLRRAPKIISYCLWLIVGLRLLFPFTFESMAGLIPFNSQPIPVSLAAETAPSINSGIRVIDNAINNIMPSFAETHGTAGVTPYETAAVNAANPMLLWATAGFAVWVTGMLAMLGYGAVTYVLLKRRMREAVLVEGNIYEAEIETPFILGFLSPKIYLPFDLPPRDYAHVILHEQTHIRRRDYIVKLAGYLILCLHWFNPFAWLAFLLMGADMEMSCDEAVLARMGNSMKKVYSLSLLQLSINNNFIKLSPLAFAEGGLKERVKNVLNFKKKSKYIAVLAGVLAVLLSFGLLASRASNGEPEVFGYGSGSGLSASEAAVPAARLMTAMTVEAFEEYTKRLNDLVDEEVLIIPEMRVFLNHYTLFDGKDDFVHCRQHYPICYVFTADMFPNLTEDGQLYVLRPLTERNYEIMLHLYELLGITEGDVAAMEAELGVIDTTYRYANRLMAAMTVEAFEKYSNELQRMAFDDNYNIDVPTWRIFHNHYTLLTWDDVNSGYVDLDPDEYKWMQGHETVGVLKPITQVTYYNLLRLYYMLGITNEDVAATEQFFGIDFVEYTVITDQTVRPQPVPPRTISTQAYAIWAAQITVNGSALKDLPAYYVADYNPIYLSASTGTEKLMLPLFDVMEILDLPNDDENHFYNWTPFVRINDVVYVYVSSFYDILGLELDIEVVGITINGIGLEMAVDMVHYDFITAKINN